MTEERKEEPKNEKDWRRELIESVSEGAKARLKALEDSQSRVDEMFRSIGEEQRERLRKPLEDIQSPLFGIELPQVTRARETLQAERERDRLDTILRRPIPSPEVMALGELSGKLDEMVQITKAALASEEKARRSEAKWRTITIAIALFGVLTTIVNIVIALTR